MRLLKKTGLILGTLLMLAVVGCSATPTTITAVTTETNTITTTQNNTTTAILTQTATVTNITTAVPVTLTILAASSLTTALNAINTLYTQSKPWVTITPVYGSSGSLQTQIQNGAPCDVFFSAATSNMATLQTAGLLLTGSTVNLLTNKIELITPKGNPLGLTSFSDIALPKVVKVALGDPASVPAGVYAQQALTELGLWTAIEAKNPVLGANVTQVLQYVDSGNVDAGIVYYSDAITDSNVTIIDTGPADVNATIIYPAAIIKASKNAAAAQDYLNFLSSAQAKAVFVQYGFGTVS